MGLILDCNSEIDLHVKSNLCNLICLRYLIRSRAVTGNGEVMGKDKRHGERENKEKER